VGYDSYRDLVQLPGDDAMTWDGHERRTPKNDLQGRRDPDDRHCADHHVMWEYHDREKDDHRTAVCGAINKLEQEHRCDMEELNLEIKSKADAIDVEKKADSKDLRGLMITIKILIGLCCLIVAGQAVWLKTDIANVSTLVQRVNIRITETVNDRVATDIEQTKKLGYIEGELKTISWRMSQLENVHNPVNKFIPDK
jgi:hypothetical protein